MERISCKNKRKVFFLFSIAFILLGCSDNDSTSVFISVKNVAGVVQPNVLIYEFEKPASDQYGSHPAYANTNVVTNSQGVAQFDLKGYEFDSGKTETTLYFTVLEDSGDNYNVVATVDVKIKKGETKTQELIIK